MIRAVTVTNPDGDSLEMDLFRPYGSGMNITAIDGLGPGKATVNSTEIYGRDGAFFNSARLPLRQITLKIEFLESPDIETVRQRTYRYFPLMKEVKLTFKTDNRLVYIRGIVSSNEPDIFQKRESTTIVLDCYDPYFYGVHGENDGKFSFTETYGGFSFPFSNPSGSKTLQFGSIARDTSGILQYDGDINTGLTITFEASFGGVVNPWFQVSNMGQKLTINTKNLPVGKAFTLGQQIVVTTMRGQKSITQYDANGVPTFALMAIKPWSDWPTLDPGDNYVWFGADTGADNMTVTLKYESIYGAL